MIVDIGLYGKFYRCPLFGQCKLTIKMKANGEPLGFPVGVKTRQKRSMAHELLNRIWNYNDYEERQQMYQWLKENSRFGHIAQMASGELNEIISKANQILNHQKQIEENKIPKFPKCDECGTLKEKNKKGCKCGKYIWL